MNFRIPPREEVGYLDAEIAGEGEKVVLSDGEIVNWTPPPVKPVMPDLSQVKSIRHYFGRTGYQTWPAWLYHPEAAPRIVKDAKEALALGVRYRQATADELSRYGVKAVWDYAEDSLWRSQPYEGRVKFDPANPGQGKNVIIGAPNPTIAQNELVRALIPEVAAAVAQALKSTGGASPSHADPKEWEEFKAFLAFKKAAEVVGALDEPAPAAEEESALGGALTADEERMLWEAEAERKGIKMDGRWSLARLKSEVEKAA